MRENDLDQINGGLLITGTMVETGNGIFVRTFEVEVGIGQATKNGRWIILIQKIVNFVLITNIVIHPIYIIYNILYNHPINKIYLLFTLLTISSSLLLFYVINKKKGRK